MKLKILLTLVITGLMLNIGCTSSNDGESDAVDAESSDPALQSEGAEAAESMDQTDGEEISSEEDLAEDETVANGDTENLPEESLEEGAATAGEEEIAAEGQELADGSITNDASTAEPTNDEDSSFTSETPQETASSDIGKSDMGASDVGSSESFAPKPIVTLKKIKDVPYTEAGILLNTVYLARQGDTWKSVSTKIYGSADKSKELKTANPYLAARALKVGDKVYYNSPKRAQDGERMLTYYEDNGIPAQTYVAKSGDNIRVISKDLLGDTGSWKEVWSTNMAVESKGDLAEGTELRYWTDAGAVASATPAPESASESTLGAEAPAQATNSAPVQDDFALPDDMNDSGAAGTVAAVEPPSPPPPPPPKIEKNVASKDLMGDKDMTFILAAGGLLLAGIGIILSIVKKNRARRMSMNTNTQI